MENLTLFISSSDSYEDCWGPFFTLLKRFWPGCDLPIVLNTERKAFQGGELNVVSTLTGKQTQFGATLHAGLDRVTTDNVILIMIDYFIMRPVDADLLEAHYKSFLEEDLDGLMLVEMETIKQITPLRENIALVSAPGPDRFSFQVAIWKKEALKRCVLRHEDPWMAEWFGSMRYRFMPNRLAYVLRSSQPFEYLHTGAIHKGGWVQEAVPELEAMGIQIDWTKRGFYKWKQPTVLERVRRRWKTRNAEFLSRLHLLTLRWGIVGRNQN